MSPQTCKLIYLILIILPAFSACIKNNDKDSNTINTEKAYDRFEAFSDAGEYDDALIQINALISNLDPEIADTTKLRFIIKKAELLRKVRDRRTALQLLESYGGLIDSIGLTTTTAYYYNRKAAILYELEQSDRALHAAQKSINVDSTLNQQSWRTCSNLTIQGAIYRDKGDYKQSQDIFRRAMEEALKMNDSEEYNQSLFNLVIAFDQGNEFDSVIVYAKDLLDNTSDHPLNERRHRTLNMLADNYYSSGKVDSAYIYADSSYDIAFDHWLTVVDDRVKMYKSSSELQKEQLQNEILATENERQLLLFYLLITIIIGISIIAFLNYRQRKEYKKLSESKQLINAKLTESLAFNNKLIGIVAHDIRNPMANITSMVNLYKRNDLDSEMVEELINQLDDASFKTNLLLENLLRWIKSQDSEFVPKYTEIDLFTLVTNVISELQTQINNKEVTVDISVSPFKVKSDKDFLNLIMRNLLTNAIKFSNPNQKILIKTQRQENTFHLEVIDHGIGMSPEQLKQLNDGISFSEWGTNAEKGTGLGVKLVKELVHVMDGQITFESKKDTGTSVTISLPINIPQKFQQINR